MEKSDYTPDLTSSDYVPINKKWLNTSSTKLMYSCDFRKYKGNPSQIEPKKRLLQKLIQKDYCEHTQ